MNAEYWLDRAVEDIRFAPDRKAVRKELEAHLEDRREKFEAQGLEGYEAEKAAAEAMGDPAEVAEELARVHTPYWGWLWRASQWALAAVALWAAVTLGPVLWNELRQSGTDPGESGYDSVGEVWETGDAYTTQYGVEVDILESWSPGGRVKLGNYRFCVPGTWLERRTFFPEEDGEPETYYVLAVLLRADTWRFWETADTGQFMVLANTVTDSEGRRYRYGDPEDSSYVFCLTEEGLFSTWYRVELGQVGPEDLPDWVDIPVGYGGAGLRVDLERGRVS